jgi:hypothetical protein
MRLFQFSPANMELQNLVCIVLCSVLCILLLLALHVCIYLLFNAHLCTAPSQRCQTAPAGNTPGGRAQRKLNVNLAEPQCC